MKNTIRAKGFGFAVRRGLIDIGRNYRLNIWAVELHWTCPWLTIGASRLWRSTTKPTRLCIALCAVVSPLAMLVHWLIVVPSCAMVFAALFAVMAVITTIGFVLAWLGEKLLRVWRLR